MAGESLSKNIYAPNSGTYPYTISVSWSESSPNIANNTSIISISASLSAGSISFDGSPYTSYLRLYWWDNKRNTHTEVASISFTSCGMGYGTRSVSGTITVPHKDDGSLSGHAWVRFTAGSSSGGWSPGSIDFGGTDKTLTTIARASSISSLSSANGQLGGAVTIGISPKVSSFKHKVEWTFANSSWATITTTATTSASFTPELSLASRIPNSTKGTLTIRVTTYNGSTQIGSSVTKAIDLAVPTSVVPTMGDPTATRVDNGIPESWGVYVQGYSKCTVTIVNAAGALGSTIKSYSIYGGGISSTASSATTDVLNTTGTITFTCTITDSRGRTASKTVSIDVVKYTKPSIKVSASRCNSSGTIMADGTYLKVTADWTIASVSSKNSVSSRSVTCNSVSNTTFGDASAFILAANVSIGSQYVLTATVKDALGNSATATINIPTAERILNIRKNKKGIAFGKFSEKDAFEVAMNAEFTKNVDIKGALSVTGSEPKFYDTLRLDKGSYVREATNESDTAGYVKIATFSITGTNSDKPIRMIIGQRNRPTPCEVWIQFADEEVTDPDLAFFSFFGDNRCEYYMVKTATSTWDLYAVKTTGYDNVSILSLNIDPYMQNRVTISYPESATGTTVSTLPDGYIKAQDLFELKRRNVDTKTLSGTYNGKTLTLYMVKNGSVVTAKLQWIGTCPSGSAHKVINFTSLAVPQGWRPTHEVFEFVSHVAGSTIFEDKVSRYTIDTDGTFRCITSSEAQLERQCSFTWITTE